MLFLRFSTVSFFFFFLFFFSYIFSHGSATYVFPWFYCKLNDSSWGYGWFTAIFFQQETGMEF